MIGVGLRTDQRTIESHTDLFKQSVGRIVRGPESRGLHHVITIGQFQRQLNLQETLAEVHVIFLRIHLEFHGVDACRVGLNGYDAITGHAKISGWNVEQAQLRIQD